MTTEQKPRGQTPPADREQKRWISQQEILLIAMRAAAVIEEELNAVKEAGVMFDDYTKDKLLSALVNTGAAWLEVKRTDI